MSAIYRQEKTVTVGKNSGGIAICVKKNIKVKIIKNLTNISDNIEVLGIKVKLEQGKNLNILGIYRKPYGVKKIGTWTRLINSLFKNITQNDLTLITGDFNAHHRLWNCFKTDENGERLLEELEEKDIHY